MSNRNPPFWMILAIAVACVSIGISGCMHNSTLAPVPVAAPPHPATERPMNVAPDTDASPPHPVVPPPPRITEDAAPPALADDIPLMKMPSAPPRAPAEKTAGREPEPVDRTPAPQIVPQISASEQQNYERQANADVSAAQQNLVQADARQLNDQQRDLRDKVMSFLKQSRDAGKAGDWAAAQNFAQKARLLSVQLLNTL